LKPLRVYFSARYAPSATPSLARLSGVARRLAACANVELCAPRALDLAALDGLHSAAYTAAFLAGEEPLASSQGIAWSPEVRDAVLAMLGGQLDGAAHALAQGVAMNLARGFHHAGPARGGGFCAMNGLALVAHHWSGKRIFVIDCDEHGGDGTEEFCSRLPNLYNATIFGTRYGCRGAARSWLFPVDVRRQGFAAYRRALDDVAGLLQQHRPDLILYQAGVDCHRDDPKGGRAGLSTLQLFQRDRLVFGMARAQAIPLLFVVAGGYQDARKLAALNLNTVKAALGVFRG
jgi:acetoin utilization deacetylase AcuC-like enzyme